jgi:hypothetical protein
MLVSDLKVKPTYIISLSWRNMRAYIEKGEFREYIKLRWANYFDVAVMDELNGESILFIADATESKVKDALSEYVEGLKCPTGSMPRD